MNDCSIGSQGQSRTWIGEVTFSNVLVSLLDSILILYDTEIINPFSTDISIQIQIIWITVVSVLNTICVSAELT